MSDQTPQPASSASLGVNLSRSGPPDTVLPDEPAAITDAITASSASDDRRSAVAAVVASAPRSLLAWAELGDATDPTDAIGRYAAFRVGYHRGLDTLRQAGWRGTGYVRWAHPSNRPFLRCLAGLGAQAALIGETDEAERIETFLRQLDPAWPPRTDDV